jgi:hypothetical protein
MAVKTAGDGREGGRGQVLRATAEMYTLESQPLGKGVLRSLGVKRR